MAPFLLLMLDAPLHGWGDVARDSRRPASEAPGRSAITGLLANALGFRYEDADRSNALQSALRLASCLHTPDEQAFLVDFQTAYLQGGAVGWTRRGVEGRIGDYAEGNTILRKEYTTGSTFSIAFGLRATAPVSILKVRDALQRPARTLFLGRRACIPTRPVLEGLVEAETASEALRTCVTRRVPVWYDEGEGPVTARLSEPDHRDFRTDRFSAGARVFQAWMEGPTS